MLKISMSLIQSPDEGHAPSPVQLSGEACTEKPREALPCASECDIPDGPDSVASIESDVASTSPQIAPPAENRFAREDPW